MTGVKSKAVKCRYLRGYLAGSDLKFLKHLTIMNENYDTAIQLVKEEYYNIFDYKCDIKIDSEKFVGMKQYSSKRRIVGIKKNPLNWTSWRRNNHRCMSYTYFPKLINVLIRGLFNFAGFKCP